MDANEQLSLIEPELYLLIQKFLSVSPLKETFKVLTKELREKNILPVRLDWQGNKHKRPCNELEKLYPHIGPKHLLQICARIGPILDKEYPPCVKGIVSLLGAGRQSLLRKKKTPVLNLNSIYYATRKNGLPMNDHASCVTHNILNVLIGRELSGPITRTLVCPSRYGNLQLQRQTLGHLSAVYCLMFDHSGRYIITGADDLLIKVWSSVSGRLLSTFRGASSEITDIDINLENTLLAAGSIDRILRVWDLQTGAPVAVLTGHTGMITSVNFCPLLLLDVYYLVTTSTDGSVAFWTYCYDKNNRANFVSKPIVYQERLRPGQAKMICSSFSPGGCFLATGSADHHVRVYYMNDDEGPRRILEMEAHSDRVDSIQWAHSGLKFVSGSKDGTAYIWHFESQQWKNQKLGMNTKLPDSAADEVEDPKKIKVTMVAWDASDTWIITAVSDFRLKIWMAESGQLKKALSGHTDEIYVLESHPKDAHIVLSAGHDGQMYVWNIMLGKSIAHFTNNIEGQGYGAVFDAKWSPCGNMIAASDSHGHILIFGFGSGNAQLKILPKELFFHTDYRPLVRDANHKVLDEQTQVAPHLMPPPFLVDIDGNPYPPMLQRLVPGRENCESEQLVPNIVVGNEGTQEVIEGLPEENLRYDMNNQLGESSRAGAFMRSTPRTGMRTSSDIEGIRQSSGNWQRDSNIVWRKNILVQKVDPARLVRTKEIWELMARKEASDYNREMRHRPIMINTMTNATVENGKGKRKKKHYHTRSAEMEGSDMEQDEEDANTSGTEYSTNRADLMSSDSSSEFSESSGYSDWVADQGVNLEPPKRSKRKHIARQTSSPVNETHNKLEPQVNITVNKEKIKEVPEIYKPLDWLAETMPKKAPYCPQMGDEVVYFRQGHQLYIDAVHAKKLYEINAKDLPWTKNNLKDQEFVKIVGIKYEIRPPRLCCLKLALLDNDGRLTGNVFTVKYHDMPDVLDFFVLKQTYEIAISRQWNQGDKFRCMIDDCWWIGEVVSKSPVSEDFPNSRFMYYEISWDNGEYERMSPWDMEPLKEDRMPENLGEAVPVLPEEIQNMLYQSQFEEWPHGDRDGATRRIIAGLDNVMSLAIAEPFLVPVDLNDYPTYAFTVEYPIDLSTIKARFENNFYRRITSSQFDVRYLATNAEKFNSPHSVIVKNARIITELCLRIIKASTEVLDVNAVYHQLVNAYESSDSEAEDDIFQPGPSTVRCLRPLTTRTFVNPDDWKVEARKLLDALWHCDDSAPFRAPVDHLKHPEYHQVIDTPMDLGSVKEDLLGGNYEVPYDFCKDMRLIFQNSKNFNTNKRSKIYAMTVRLSAMFEEHMGRLIYNWKMAKKRSKSRRNRSSNEMNGKDSSDEESRPTRTQQNNTIPVARVSIPRSVNASTRNQRPKVVAPPPKIEVEQSSSNKRKLSMVNGVKSSSSNDPSSADDSDYEPLSKWRNANYKEQQLSNKRNVYGGGSSSSESDVVRKTIMTRNAKRPRYVKDSDSSSSSSNNTSDGTNSSSSESVSGENGRDSNNTDVVTVSSRGRIRRMTARARALLKKN